MWFSKIISSLFETNGEVQINTFCLYFAQFKILKNGLIEKVNNVELIKQVIVLLPLPFNEGVYN